MRPFLKQFELLDRTRDGRLTAHDIRRVQSQLRVTVGNAAAALGVPDPERVLVSPMTPPPPPPIVPNVPMKQISGIESGLVESMRRSFERIDELALDESIDEVVALDDDTTPRHVP